MHDDRPPAMARSAGAATPQEPPAKRMVWLPGGTFLMGSSFLPRGTAGAPCNG